MPHGSFGVGMLKMGIHIPGALFHQVTESAISQAVAIAARQVAAKLINGDLKNQPGSGGSSWRRWGS